MYIPSERERYNQWRFSDDWWKFISRKKKSQHNKCFICLDDLTGILHVDHIKPIYQGGDNEAYNLSVVHEKCNMKKGAKITMTYREACKRRRMFNRATNGRKVINDTLLPKTTKSGRVNRRDIKIYKELCGIT